MRIRAETLSRIMEGSLVRGDADVTVGKFSIDTRTIEPSDWFIALKGNNTDGHEYIGEAIKKGAAGIVLTDIANTTTDIRDLPVVSVDNPIKALFNYARYVRISTALFPWYAITGSVGKTTARDVITEILKCEGSTPLSTPGNFNTDIGVPLAVSQINKGNFDAFVLEFAMRARGEIGYLTEMTQPHIGLITNVAPVHLETLGSLDEIAEAKGELLEHLDLRSVSVLNIDDPYFEILKRKVNNKIILTYSCMGSGADVKASDWKWDDDKNISLKLAIRGDKPEELIIKTPSLGIAQSAVAGAAACVAGKVPYDKIYEGLTRFVSRDMRMNIITRKSGVRVILDCYNANPKSMTDALRVLSLFKNDGRTIAVLGGMMEIGEESAQWHRRIADVALAQKVDFLISVGKEGLYYHQRFEEMNADNTLHFMSNDDVRFWLKENTQSGDTVLIKGSRSFKLEEIERSEW